MDMDKEWDSYDFLPPPEISVKGKKRINRLFREIVGSSKIPHSEVDNFYERIRSKIMRKVKVIIFRIRKILK